MDYLTVTILAAGEGKRMQSKLPKVLHLLNSKPMLVHIIETVQLFNPHKIIVVTGKFHSIIEATLLKYMRINDIVFVEQNEPKGTGHAINCCLSEYKEDGPVLIVNGDMPLLNESVLKKLIDSGHDSAILTASFENPQGYGRVICDKRGAILKIVEEKDCTDSEKAIRTINTGVYCIHSFRLKEFIPKLDCDNAQQEYYLTDIAKLLNNRFMPAMAIELNKSENIYVSGVNTKEELANLERLALV